MKAFFKYLLITVFGSVGFVLFVAVIALLILLIPDGEPVFGRKQATAVFTENRDAFETVCRYMSDFDLSPYTSDDAAAPYMNITHNDAKDAEKPYTVSVYTSEYVPVQIEDTTVAQALDTLFGKVGMAYIVQDATIAEQYIYFGIQYEAGVVYSPDGEKPSITPERVPYLFRRIDDHWFYWCDDD